MQRNRQLHHPEARAQVASRHRRGGDDRRANLFGQLREFG